MVRRPFHGLKQGYALTLGVRRIGMNFVLYGACLTMLTIRRRTPKVNKLLVAIATVMFAFSTAHVSLGFQRLIEGFIVLRDKPGGPGAFFSDVSIPANVVKVGIHTVNVRAQCLLNCASEANIPPALILVYHWRQRGGTPGGAVAVRPAVVSQYGRRSGGAGSCGAATGRCASCPSSLSSRRRVSAPLIRRHSLTDGALSPLSPGAP